MDYVDMLKDAELVLGFKELLDDSDALVVKRTMRVFSLVYQHALKAVGSNCHTFKEEDLLAVWMELKDVVDTIFEMVPTCENEGILIHIIRFFDAAIQAHLSPDLHRYPRVLECGRDVVRRGLKCLKDLVTTPYINGTSFIIATKSLISIACLRDDLHGPVGELILAQFYSLPPTLFDHNVRSFYKMLQRNLVLFLKKIRSDSLRDKLVEIAVKSGVHRKVIAQYMSSTPLPNDKKRPIDSSSSDDRSESLKKARVDPPASGSTLRSPPAKVRDHVRQPQPLPGSRSSTPEKKETELDDDRKEEGREIEEDSTKSLSFLTSLLPTLKNSNSTSPDNDVDDDLAKRLTERLDLCSVVELVLKCLPDVAEEEPLDFTSKLKQRIIASHDIDEIKNNIAYWLIKNEIISKLEDVKSKSSESRETKKIENKTIDRGRLSPKIERLAPPPTKDEKVASAPEKSVLPTCVPKAMDTDLRSLLPPVQQVTQVTQVKQFDVDMRVFDRREEIKSRDPRVNPKDPRTQEKRSSPNRDPRASQPLTRDPRLSSLKPDPIGALSEDPTRLTISRDPRTIARSDPRFESKRIPSPKMIDAETKLPQNPLLLQQDPRLRKDQLLINPAQMPPFSLAGSTAPPHIMAAPMYNNMVMAPQPPFATHHMLHNQQFGMGMPPMNCPPLTMSSRPPFWGANSMQNVGGHMLMNGQMPHLPTTAQAGTLQSLMNL